MISIYPERKITEFQRDFSVLFPFLKVEFFTRPHEEGGATWSKYMHFDGTKTLGEIGHVQGETTFEFSAAMQVGKFEQALWEQYGLAVQVFRKSMNTFIETTKTDSWTLAEQNAKGEESAHTLIDVIYEQRSNEGS